MTDEKDCTYEGELHIFKTHMTFYSEKCNEDFHFQAVGKQEYIQELENNREISGNGICIDYYMSGDYFPCIQEDHIFKYTFKHKKLENSMFDFF
ncbi:hypothetical protein HZS_4788 [Henneguya salminicola]|nr:hypothetical protein HZS_4788 [Henneguya salminicola]